MRFIFPARRSRCPHSVSLLSAFQPLSLPEAGACFGDVLEINESQDNVLEFRGVHPAADRVGCGPHLCLKSEVGADALLRRSLWHVSQNSLRRTVDELLTLCRRFGDVEIEELRRKYKVLSSKDWTRLCGGGLRTAGMLNYR